MPLIIKTGGSLVSLEAVDLKIGSSGSLVSPSQGFVKQSGAWLEVWAPDEGTGDTGGSTSPLPAGVPRWGVAQFSDTDFTGGKTDPNTDGQPYTRWAGPQEFIDSELQTYDSSMFVDLSVPFPDYGYFAHKASDGTATFLDSAQGWPGGWDGAKWSDGGFGSENGPISVMYDDGTGPAEWLVYRTDFSGIGDMAWNVTIA